MDKSQRKAWREALARKYPTEAESRVFVDAVGLRPEKIAFQPRADLTWFSVLEEAGKQGGPWIRKVVEQALSEFPDDEVLQRLLHERPVYYKEGAEPVPQGRRTGVQLEKIIGKQSTLVPVSFLERGFACAQAVARVHCADGGFGSGFLIEGDLLVTNHHVIDSPETAAGAHIEFNVQRLADGRAAGIDKVSCRPADYFLTSGTDDFTVVKLGGTPSARWTPIRLQPVRAEVDARVNIIQHPGGGEKQLSYFHNMVVYVGNGRVQYLTDTLPGSSGSPVFDSEWRVVAVHHSGGWLMEPGTTGGTSFRNEGIDINLVREAMERSASNGGSL